MELVDLYWTEGEGVPTVSLQGVTGPTKGENLLKDFRDLCHRHYIARSAAVLGLTVLRKQQSTVLPQNMSGSMGYISRPSDLGKPPMSPAVPQMGLQQYNEGLEPSGDFTQYQNRALLVFIYQTWEDSVRPAISNLYGVDVSRIRCHLMGDLRRVRHDIIHRGGRNTEGKGLCFLPQIWKVDVSEWKFEDDEIRRLMDQLCALQVFVADLE